VGLIKKSQCKWKRDC